RSIMVRTQDLSWSERCTCSCFMSHSISSRTAAPYIASHEIAVSWPSDTQLRESSVEADPDHRFDRSETYVTSMWEGRLATRKIHVAKTNGNVRGGTPADWARVETAACTITVNSVAAAQ